MKILVSLFALAVWLALPGFVEAATGGSCTIEAPTASAGLSSAPAAKVTCVVVAEATAAGAATFGPVYVPGGGVGYSMAIIRPLKGTLDAGCGYDDLIVYELSAPTLAAYTERISIGVLDDDGTSTPTGGVQQIKVFGPVGPYLYLSGTVSDAGTNTCSTAVGETLVIQLLLYPNISFP